MKRKVELFIQEGMVIKMAEPYSTKNNYGQIKVANSVNAPDQCNVIVYTHYDHSFLRDKNGNPNQPEITEENGQPIYFFLIPMEYLFSEDDLAGDADDTPLLAVNVTTSFPYLESYKDRPCNRHPCTTSLTVAPDPSGGSLPVLLSLNFLLLPVMSIRFFFNSIFHPNRRYFYGINDYGELTIIETNTKKEASIITPFTKIVLGSKKTHPHFRRIYSPKLKGNRRDEFKILIQCFAEMDPEWYWKFNPPLSPDNPNNPKNLISPIDPIDPSNLKKN